MLHSFWYSAAEKTFRDVLAQDPTARSRRWGFAAILMSNPLAGRARRRRARSSAGRDRQGARTPPKTQRERDYIEAVAAYYEDWANRPERARQLAREGFRGARGEVSGRRRGADLLRALHRGHAVAGRPDLRRVPEGGRDPRDAIREISRPSRRRALPDSQLRRAADRAEGARSPRAATPASRRMRRTRCTCLRTSSRASDRGKNRSPPTCARPRSRGKAARPTRRITRATMRCTRTCSSGATARRGARWKRRCRSPALHPGIAHRALRDRPRCPRAMRWSAAPGVRRCSCSRRPTKLPVRRSHHLFRARDRRGAQRRRGRGREGCRAARRDAQSACRTREEHLLGDRSRSAAARGRGMDRAGAGQRGGGAEAHARGRRPRGRNEKHIVTPGRICPRASCWATCCSSRSSPPPR